MAARKRFGELCVELGFTSNESATRALQIQKELQAGGMDPPFIGEILVREGFITAEQRDQVLEASGDIPADFIPGYEVLSRIGRGARGIVYKARQKSMDRLVALKILPRKMAEDRKWSEKFTREAKSVAKLNHPNIISGIDVGEHEGCHFFVMEYVDGISLAALIRSGTQPIDKVIDLARQLGEALEHAHSHGIVHRDIKPDNILITRDGVTKLCDYGLAGQVTTSAPGQRLKKVEGTPQYLSPEQAKGLPDIDIRSDLYSLGATLFHALTGEPPFNGSEAIEIMKKHLNEKAPTLKEKGVSARPSHQKLLDRLLEKDREKRFQTPGELLDFLGGLSKGPRRGSPGDSASGSGWKQRKKRQLLGSGVGGLLIAALLGAVLFALPKGDSANAGTEPRRTAAGTDTGEKPRTEINGTGNSGRERAPPPGSASAEERAAAAEWDTIMDLTDDSVDSLGKTAEVIQRIEEYIQKHQGSAGARQAEMILTYQGDIYEALLGDEFAHLEDRVDKATQKGEFRKAAKLAEEFQGKHEDPSYALRASGLIQQVQTDNDKAFDKATRKADGFLKKEKFKEASKVFTNLAATSTDSVEARCLEKVEAIGSLLAKKEGAERLADLQIRIEAYISENKFAEALEACAALKAKEEDPDVLAEVARREETLGRMTKTFSNLRANLDKAASSDRSTRFTLSDGETVEGRITRVNPESLQIVIKVAGERESVTWELSRLSGEMLDKLARGGGNDEDDSLNGAIFFLVKENYPAAHLMFEAAVKEGARVPDWVFPAMVASRKSYREDRAEELLAKAQTKMDGKLWKSAANILKGLIGELEDTSIYEKEKNRIRSMYYTCKVEIGILDGPSAVLKGQVDALRKGVHRFTYDFAKAEQLEDWIPDTVLFPASVHKHQKKVMQIFGKVDHRVRFVGDISVEFTAASRAARNPNINILLNDGAETGYLFGLGFKPRTEWVSLQMQRGQGLQPGQVVLPANVIVGWPRPPMNGGLGPRAFLEALRLAGVWGKMKPIATVNRKYKVKVSHQGKVLRFVGLNKTLVQMPEYSDKDTGGSVSFVPFGSTILIHRVVITGKYDKEWLEEEIREEVDKLFAKD
ncbi:MAG: serine/threonine-protein kinase [Planctomycetota bacterium]|nr:serine/threonine-protein kinase [Planctomycetota bacterium]